MTAQELYFETFKHVFEAINKYYGDMPNTERSNYLCFVFKDAWHAAKNGENIFKKKDIVLIPKKSRAHLDICTRSGEYNRFQLHYMFVGSFGYLFTMDPDQHLSNFIKWNMRRLKICAESFRLTLNRRKKICNGSKKFPECVDRGNSTVCVCEQQFKISEQIRANIPKN